MRYAKFPAPAHLHAFVKCIWILEDDGATPSDEAEAVVPDGSMELVVHYGAPFERQSEHGPVQTPVPAALAGQITAPLWLRPTGALGVIGVRFRPHGAAAFVRERLIGVRDTVLDVEDVWGREARWLAERVGEARGDAERIELLCAFLEIRLRPDPGLEGVAAAARLIERRRGRVSIDEVLQSTGIGRRRLERGFARAVGLSPKQLARILRFQTVFARLEAAPDTAWSAVAHDCGYYDQAHLIRDFRALAGATPAAWRSAEHELTDRFAGLVG